MVARLVADLPHAGVGPVPVVHHPLEDAGEVVPGVVADAVAVLVEQVDRVDQLAVDVELQLVDGGVADPHRARVAVAAQVVELDSPRGRCRRCRRAPAAGRARRRRRARSPSRSESHAHERAASSVKPSRSRRVEAERRVADPDVAVVPVALAADLLGQARRRRGDDRAGRLVGEQLEGEGGAVDRLAPAARCTSTARASRARSRPCARTARCVSSPSPPGPGSSSSSSTSRTNSASSPSASATSAVTAPSSSVEVGQVAVSPRRTPSPVDEHAAVDLLGAPGARGRSRAGRRARMRSVGLARGRPTTRRTMPLPVVLVVRPSAPA